MKETFESEIVCNEFELKPKIYTFDRFELFFLIKIIHFANKKRMILIPQRLFNNKQVNTLLRDGNVCILSKTLSLVY